MRLDKQTCDTQFIRLCRASNLAEAWRISSPLSSPWPAKRRAPSMPLRPHVHYLRPSTHCSKLSRHQYCTLSRGAQLCGIDPAACAEPPAYTGHMSHEVLTSPRGYLQRVYLFDKLPRRSLVPGKHCLCTVIHTWHAFCGMTKVHPGKWNMRLITSTLL